MSNQILRPSALPLRVQQLATIGFAQSSRPQTCRLHNGSYAFPKFSVWSELTGISNLLKRKTNLASQLEAQRCNQPRHQNECGVVQSIPNLPYLSSVILQCVIRNFARLSFDPKLHRAEQLFWCWGISEDDFATQIQNRYLFTGFKSLELLSTKKLQQKLQPYQGLGFAGLCAIFLVGQGRNASRAIRCG